MAFSYPFFARATTCERCVGAKTATAWWRLRDFSGAVRAARRVDVDADGDANDDVDVRCVDDVREPAMYRACVVTDVRIVGGCEVMREGVERRTFWRVKIALDEVTPRHGIARRVHGVVTCAMSKRSARTPRGHSPVTIDTPELVTPGAVTPTTRVPGARGGNLGTAMATAIAGTSATRKRPRDDGDAADDELGFLVSIESFLLCKLPDKIVESDDFEEIMKTIRKRKRRALQARDATRMIHDYSFLDTSSRVSDVCSRTSYSQSKTFLRFRYRSRRSAVDAYLTA